MKVQIQYKQKLIIAKYKQTINHPIHSDIGYHVPMLIRQLPTEHGRD